MFHLLFGLLIHSLHSLTRPTRLEWGPRPGHSGLVHGPGHQAVGGPGPRFGFVLPRLRGPGRHAVQVGVAVAELAVVNRGLEVEWPNPFLGRRVVQHL